MLFKSVLAVFAAGIAAVSANTNPSGKNQGNPIYKPGLNEQVPVGVPYTITWDPTTTGTVSLLLLRGPSTNVVPIATIVEGIANTGTYQWTPSTSLENDVTHYGIQLIVDATGDYQYTTQFGISNPNGASSSAVSSVVSATSSLSAYSTSSAIKTASANSTLITSTKAATSSYVASTGFPAANSSVVAPTKPLTVPTSLYATATATTTGVVQATGAAGHVKAALGLVGAVAGLVMVL